MKTEMSEGEYIQKKEEEKERRKNLEKRRIYNNMYNFRVRIYEPIVGKTACTTHKDVRNQSILTSPKTWAASQGKDIAEQHQNDLWYLLLWT